MITCALGIVICFKALSHQSGVLTAFPQRSKVADHRGERYAGANNAVERLWSLETL